ncbi:hypothetical protein MKW94_010102 [Papaver nudicaule]|uniref:NOG C-terminal domain-containing protein n=1 Tax=Papaver nudicaule TaxID=74823 RepID=A0AA42AQT8_PAPNU|nr:hypothetical protein [Papaver nudicaule]
MKLVRAMKDEAAKTMIGEGGEPSDDANVLLTMSTLTGDGVISVKNAACEKLLNQRVDLKMNSKKINDCLNRFHVAIPKPRDQKERPPCIPQSVLEFKASEAAEIKEKLERDLENENGGAGVYTANLKKHYILEHDEWKHGIMPEILDGHNVHDFVDADILQRLEELEQEEGLQLEHEEIDEDSEMDVGKDWAPEEQETLAEIRKQKILLIEQHRMKNGTAGNNPIVPRKMDKDKEYSSERMGRHLSTLGLDPSLAIKRATSRSLSRGIKRDRSSGVDDDCDAMDIDKHANKKLCLRALSRPKSRSSSKPPGEVVPGEGFKNAIQKVKALKLARNSSKKRNKQSRVGEADRVIANLKPKHLFTGKRSNGKTNRR